MRSIYGTQVLGDLLEVGGERGITVGGVLQGELDPLPRAVAGSVLPLDGFLGETGQSVQCPVDLAVRAITHPPGLSHTQ
ncbi:hypothetical protein [Streptomyces sp. NPDC004014]